MKITHIELKNWAQHKHLQANTDAPVVGVLAPNGSGKTNLLSAVAFAFSGLLDKVQESYVHMVDGVREKNASVEVHFVKGGVQGVILRQIGASPKHELTWGGDKVKGVKAINERMREILNCERWAMQMAVFLGQGKLTECLFGTETEREKQFAQMMLIDHLYAIGEIVSEEIVRVSKRMQDLGPLRDEAKSAQNDAEAALRLAEDELTLYPDRSRDLNFYRGYLDKTERLAVLQRERDVVHGRIHEIQLKEAQLAAPAGVTPSAEGVEELTQQIRQAESARDAAIAARNELENRSAWERALETAVKELAGLGGVDEAAVTSRMTQLSQQITSHTEAQKRHLLWEKSQARLSVLSKAVESAGLEVQAAEAALAQLPAVDAAEEGRIQRLATASALKIQVLGVARNLHETSCCPLCEGTDLTKLQHPDYVAMLQQEINDLEREIRERKAAYERSKNNLNAATARLTSAKNALQAAALEVGSFKAEGAESKEDDAAKILELTAEYQKLNASISQIRSAREREESARRQLDGFGPREAYEAKIALSPAPDLLPGLSAKKALLQDYLHRVSDLQASRAALAARNQELADKIKAGEKEVVEAKLDCPAGFDADQAACVARKIELEQQAEERMRRLGAVTASTDALRRAERRVADIEERMQHQQQMRELVSQLEELKRAFSRQGIARHHLSKVFDILVEMTQEIQTEWEADFQVIQCPDKLFNFQFFRTKDPNTLLDQSDLSGGQRVRLSLSFVQAVQRLVFPGLEFLCVDEPSTHLDPEGKEGLARLFEKIAADNADSESQVWVVDHAPELERAFSKVIRLSPAEG
jgi:DNA repair exonuclease SbcCD ATPase subunit